ncbi:uncharacterized protein LOC110637521 isoform X4 [Hevea brasiliensis]|uniref:uncharacterized protein LOC110637521 isoform X4 n=1 Tax=Hevea brasiliensis TaxID=3981 RepID=UPI0025F257E1|nr:uncharacterized protein LOC110637521 isoform X4 [Hevea brasiliensis]
MEQLRECIEELVKFTLNSHINETLEFDLGLSKDFCSNLLRDDPNDSVSLPDIGIAGCFEGVPQYPLFTRLASALYQCIISGSFCKTYGEIEFINEDISLKQKEDEWNKLIMEKGSDLKNMFKSTFFELHVQEPFFSLLKDGRKTIEGRCAGSNYSRIEPGALVLLNRTAVLEVKRCWRQRIFHKSFLGLKLFKKGLSYGGIQSLLGLAHTVGAVSDALPPPRSTLLSSFTLPYRPNVNGSALTHGARALAKHTERSSNKYWGIISGSDSTKNSLAMNVINFLIASCCWSNVHIVPPHGAVFEVRVADGYGARWSKDGAKFIGFLEPYMEDGYSKGWKH